MGIELGIGIEIPIFLEYSRNRLTSLYIRMNGVCVEAGLALKRGREVLHAQLRTQPPGAVRYAT
jgi:hypothetical protein